MQAKRTRYGYGQKARTGAQKFISTRRVSSRNYVRPGYTRRSGYYGRYNTRTSSELKFFDTSVNTTFDLTGEVLSGGQLCLVPQGTTESTRIGRKIVIKAIDMKAVIYVATPTTLPNDFIQLALVLDKQCNGAAAAYTDIYTTNAINSFRNMANSDRFTIIKTWRMPMNPISVDSAGTNYVYSWRNIVYHKTCNIPIEYSSTTGAITEIRSNNIFLVGIAANQDDKSTIIATVRIKYSD